ncbi:MAG: single-stranded DNA-binding protein [Planctomycetes bacterium]|nr:single-stranded DNA-binding protein [Planctomycetota bacterium]
MSAIARAVADAASVLTERCAGVHCRPPVSHVYHPLRYAGAMHAAYVQRFAATRKRVLFLGMNPGPFGMAQTGVPFGEVAAVRDWLRLSAPIGRPEHEHAKRLVQGLACTRSEVSGRRLWGMFARRFADADAFFAEHYVVNWCPLLFIEAGGRNRTPDQLPGNEREALGAACDDHLRAVVAALAPEVVVGVGKYAAQRAAAALPGLRVATIAHPSPANPAANKGWDALALRELVAQDVWRADTARA